MAIGTITAPLTRRDRCDRCGAAAQVRVTLRAGELHFCGHHARQHAARLVEIGADVSSTT